MSNVGESVTAHLHPGLLQLSSFLRTLLLLRSRERAVVLLHHRAVFRRDWRAGTERRLAFGAEAERLREAELEALHAFDHLRLQLLESLRITERASVLELAQAGDRV